MALFNIVFLLFSLPVQLRPPHMFVVGFFSKFVPHIDAAHENKWPFQKVPQVGGAAWRVLLFLFAVFLPARSFCYPRFGSWHGLGVPFKIAVRDRRQLD